MLFRSDVVLVCEHEDELEFCDFDVYRVVVFAEEDSNVVAEDLGTALEDEDGVAEGEILDFGALGEKGDERWRELAGELGDLALICNVVHKVKDDPDTCEDDGGVGV